MAVGVSVFFYPQGVYYTCNIKQDNIPSECGEWWIVVLKDQLQRGVIDDNTMIHLPGVYSGSLGALRSARGF